MLRVLAGYGTQTKVEKWDKPDELFIDDAFRPDLKTPTLQNAKRAINKKKKKFFHFVLFHHLTLIIIFINSKINNRTKLRSPIKEI